VKDSTHGKGKGKGKERGKGGALSAAAAASKSQMLDGGASSLVVGAVIIAGMLVATVVKHRSPTVKEVQGPLSYSLPEKEDAPLLQ